jgi:hypothetical protein
MGGGGGGGGEDEAKSPCLEARSPFMATLEETPIVIQI